MDIDRRVFGGSFESLISVFFIDNWGYLLVTDRSVLLPVALFAIFSPQNWSPVMFLGLQSHLSKNNTMHPLA